MLLYCAFKELEIEELFKWQFYGSRQVEQDSNIQFANLNPFYNTNFNFPIISDI